MSRAVVDPTILDSLIRAKLAQLNGCAGVQPLPVQPCDGGAGWHVPGWTGDSREVGRCSEKIAQYLSFLQSQFDIPRGER